MAEAIVAAALAVAGVLALGTAASVAHHGLKGIYRFPPCRTPQPNGKVCFECDSAHDVLVGMWFVAVLGATGTGLLMLVLAASALGVVDLGPAVSPDS